MNDSKTVVEDLAAWLTQIWDEEERLARRVADRYVTPAGRPYWPRPRVEAAFDHRDDPDMDAGLDLIKSHDPASVLARIAADRKILAECQKILAVDGWEYADAPDLAEFVIRQLASTQADRPGYPLAVERQGVEW